MLQYLVLSRNDVIQRKRISQKHRSRFPFYATKLLLTVGNLWLKATKLGAATQPVWSGLWVSHTASTITTMIGMTMTEAGT